MRLIGAAAPCSEALIEQVRDALWHGRPVMVWSDGDDVTAVVCDRDETADDLARVAAKVMPEPDVLRARGLL